MNNGLDKFLSRERADKERVMNEQAEVQAALLAQNINHNMGIFKHDEVAYVDFKLLVPFENQPYNRLSDEKLEQLALSIQENGLLNPIVFRKHPEQSGLYQILSGNNRYYAMRDILNYSGSEKVFCKYVEPENEDEAVRILIDANESQRENISDTERAAAIKLRYDTIRDTYGEEKNGRRSRDIVADEFGMSVSQVQRYLNVSGIYEGYADLLDEKQIAFETAAEIGSMKSVDQELLYQLTSGKKLKAADAKKVVKISKDLPVGIPITEEQIEKALGAKEKKKKKPKIPSEYKELIPETMAVTDIQIDNFIKEAIAMLVLKRKKDIESLQAEMAEPLPGQVEFENLN